MTSKTVEDAKAIWCPHFQLRCHADHCMMWRWKYDKINVIEMEREKYEKQGFEQIKGFVSNGIPYLEMIRSRERGYCGLAGEPEV